MVAPPAANVDVMLSWAAELASIKNPRLCQEETEKFFLPTKFSSSHSRSFVCVSGANSTRNSGHAEGGC
jgi:hypothetical protein